MNGENKLCCVCSEKKMSDNYPEYLNPFSEDLKQKPKLTIRHSFKELKRSLRQSFRIKKKDEGEVTLRQKTETLQRLPVSYPAPSQRITEALPRSRFHERVSRSDYRTNTGSNPFEEEETDETRSMIIRRRMKKRAPLPPPNKSMSSQHINDDKLEVSAGGSHWSLTSVETDYSGSLYNTITREENEPEAKRESMVEKFVDFNKNMGTLKDDTNNNVITKENQEIESNSNIPDLVVSCPSESDSTKLANNSSDAKNEADDEDKKSLVSEDDSAELVIKDITNNMIVVENTNNTHEENVMNDEVQTDEDDEPYLYHEKKSLYIAGSRDELNDSDTYTGRVSLYITGSTDDLDASNNNEVCNKNGIDGNSNDDVVPIPKQRKNKLTKNMLLGV
ncbi:hypothetical protein Zmor_002811 [Zophobas morio]|uniref:Uncharacterized protein n=1 Tax=Zophobas morio TaxID=2755281 RepID=A0AA38HK96_9CUCU|nr:hypothetical protein Zmor_002811 [Zophobas morio]